MSTLASIISAARTYYLSAYREAAIAYLARFKPSHSEVMLDRPSSRFPVPYRYYRIDLAAGAEKPPDLTEVNVGIHSSFDAFTVREEDGMTVEVHPLVWNGVEMRLEPIPKDIEPFTAWIWRWIDDGDTKPQDDVGFSGVVHSVTYPTVDKMAWCTSIDFGTAPVDAFQDLMRTLVGMGVTTVRISSFWVTKAENA